MQGHSESLLLFMGKNMIQVMNHLYKYGYSKNETLHDSNYMLL